MFQSSTLAAMFVSVSGQSKLMFPTPGVNWINDRLVEFNYQCPILYCSFSCMARERLNEEKQQRLLGRKSIFQVMNPLADHEKYEPAENESYMP